MINSRQFKEIIRDIIHEEIGTGNNYKIGTVANVNGKPTIRFAGEDQPSQKKYSFLDSYTPVEGDRVLLANVSGTYVVIGKIQQDKGLQLENEYIVESGTNENGEYVRYASGIQICWTRMSDFVIDIAIGNIYRSESQIWTYPAAFDDTYPVAVSGGIAAVNRWLGITGSPLGESVYIRAYGATSSSSSYAAYVKAIGRWK